jgi:uncharacterized membrane protein YedE/YeeE
MLRVLLLLVASSMLLFEGARRLGLLPFYPFPLLGAISPANFAGGILFGIGMVLAGGCVVGTLYRSGSGNVPAMAAVAGLVLGSGLYAEIHPAWSAFQRASALFPGKATLPQISGLDPAWFVAAASIPSGILVWRWTREGSFVRKTAVEGYIQPWAAAILLAFLGLASWLAAGMPMGITTSYAKAAAWLESCFVPGHLDSLAFFKLTPLDVVFPSGYRLTGGPGGALDGIALVQFPLIGGIVAGSFLSALSLREFRLRFRVPPRQILSGLAGGVVMGLASRMAPGCNVWHVMGGLPIFSVPSILFVLGLFPGAWIGSALIKRLV